MAGARIKIEVDDAALTGALANVQAELGAAGLRATLADIGEYLLRATRELAAEEVSPSGYAWPALSPRYAKNKAKLRPGLPMLKFDNHMLGDRLSYQVMDDVLSVGTSAPYGAIHQFGGTIHIPARSQQAYFKMRKGEVDPKFVNKKKANFAQWVTLPAYDIEIPARPWLGVNDGDVEEILRIVGDHLQAAVEGGESASP